MFACPSRYYPVENLPIRTGLLRRRPNALEPNDLSIRTVSHIGRILDEISLIALESVARVEGEFAVNP